MCCPCRQQRSRPELLACLKVRDERAAVAFWRKYDSVRVGVGRRPWWQGTAHGRFKRPICDRRRATMSALELGHLSLADALAQRINQTGFQQHFSHLWIAGTTLSSFAEFATAAARRLWKMYEMSIRIK
jgi:hypothetical protein